MEERPWVVGRGLGSLLTGPGRNDGLREHARRSARRSGIRVPNAGSNAA